MKTEKIKKIFKGIISLVILILIINLIGIKDILNATEKIRIEYFILVAITLIISMIITAFAVMPFLKIKINKLFKFKAISWATGMFLPGKLGEFSFVLLLKKTGISTKKALAVFFIDRFVSFSIIGFFALIALIKYFEFKFDFSYLIIFFVVLFVLFALKNKIKKIKLVGKVTELIKESREYLKNEKKSVLINCFFSLINFIVMFWVTQTIFFALGQKVELIDVGLISSLALLISLIPITINGIGLREGILIYLYSLVGIKPEYSALVAFIFLVSSYVIAGIFLALFYDEFSFILKRKKEIKNA